MPRSPLAWVLVAVLGCSSHEEPSAGSGPAGSGGVANASGGSPSGGSGSGNSAAGATSTGGKPASVGGGGASSSGASSSGAGQASGGGVATAGASQAGESAAGGSGGAELTLPPANAAFDYQLGGGYQPPAGVQIVTRDREDTPAAGLYNICYVNGFQTQPQDNDQWLAENADLVLHDSGGDPVIDPDWGEYLLDTSSDAKRQKLVTIVGGWIAKCAADGFDAVEIDNLDSYSRSSGLLSKDDNVSFMAGLSAVAHDHGLAIGQKNSAELVPRADELGTDFAVAEECNRYSECDAYTARYGAHVLVIEYRKQDFDKGCQAFPELSIVLRDLDLTTPQSSQYVFDGC